MKIISVELGEVTAEFDDNVLRDQMTNTRRACAAGDHRDGLGCSVVFIVQIIRRHLNEIFAGRCV